MVTERPDGWPLIESFAASLRNIGVLS
jgi:hypothetical protein